MCIRDSSMMWVRFTSPSRQQFQDAGMSFSPDQASVSGTLLLNFPKLSEQGSWTVTLQAIDGVSNRRTLESADLASMGFPAQLGVVSHLSLIHISEPTRLLSISYAVF